VSAGNLSWSGYVAALAGRSDVLAGQTFVAGGPLTFLALGAADVAIANWSAYRLANSIPDTAGVYAPRSEVFTAYWLYLSYLAQAVALRNDVAAGAQEEDGQPPARTNSLLLAADLFASYRRYIANRVVSNDVAGAGQCAYANDAFTVLPNTSGDAAHAQVLAALGAQAPAVTAALNRCMSASLQTPTEQNMAAAMPTGGAPFRCPLSGVEGIAQSLAQWRDSGAAGTSGFTIILPAASPPAGVMLMAQAATEPAGSPAFLRFNAPSARGLAANAAEPALPDGSHDCVCAMTLSLADFGTFSLMRGGWFDTDLLELSDPPLPAGSPDFFGASGSLAWVPVSVAVGYRPCVTLETSSVSAVQTIASGLTGIGPFRISADGEPGTLVAGASTNTTVSFNAADSSVPVLLGVICAPARPALST
jgi:hypothetical protein